MLIGIEASRANRPQKTGVEWYAHHVIQTLKTLPEAEAHMWLLYGNTPLSMGLERGSSNWKEVSLPWPPKYLWTQVRLSWEMMRRPPNVLFVPAHVLPRVIPRNTVVTVHDVGFYRFPKLYKPIQNAIHRFTTPDIVKRAARIITVSEYSKQEIIHFCNADPDKIFVTHLGIDHATYRPTSPEVIRETLERLRLPRTFFVFIGRLEAKKNVLALIEAFDRYKQDRGMGDPLALVLVGQPGNGFDEIQRSIAKSPNRGQIHVVGYINEVDKVALLSAATALVHPAWYEGFGFTPLEAMACQCPVVCSRAGSLPEVVGVENALWFDPSDVEALSHLLGDIVYVPEQAEVLRARGKAWVEQYKWEVTAKKTLEILTRW